MNKWRTSRAGRPTVRYRTRPRQPADQRTRAAVEPLAPPRPRWSRARKFKAAGWSLFLLGGTLASYYGIRHDFGVTPEVVMHVAPSGEISAFAIANPGSWFTFRNVTPDCVVTFALWRSSGSLYSYWVDHDPPKQESQELGPGQTTNFACNVARVVSAPIGQTAEGGSVPVELLEARIKIVLRYTVTIGPFTLPRTFESNDFCGIATGSGLNWQTGESTAPDYDASNEIDRRSFYSGHFARCFTPAELARMLGYSGDFSFRARKSGWYQFGVPKNGPFHE